jgi:hypothetical protein
MMMSDQTIGTRFSKWFGVGALTRIPANTNESPAAMTEVVQENKSFIKCYFRDNETSLIGPFKGKLLLHAFSPCLPQVNFLLAENYHLRYIKAML